MKGACSHTRGPPTLSLLRLFSLSSLPPAPASPASNICSDNKPGSSLLPGTWCLVQSALAAEDDVSNGLGVFLTKEGQLEGSKRRDKTPVTKNDPKSVWEAQPPFLCPWPLKWTLAWVPLGASHQPGQAGGAIGWHPVSSSSIHHLLFCSYLITEPQFQ